MTCTLTSQGPTCSLPSSHASLFLQCTKLIPAPGPLIKLPSLCLMCSFSCSPCIAETLLSFRSQLKCLLFKKNHPVHSPHPTQMLLLMPILYSVLSSALLSPHDCPTLFDYWVYSVSPGKCELYEVRACLGYHLS